MRRNRLAIGLIAAVLVTAPARAGYTVVDLGVLPGGTFSTGAGLNAAGLVVGRGDTAGYALQGFVGQGGTPLDVGLLPGGTFTYATGVNASGLVVGDGDTTGGAVHGFVASGPGAILDLGVKPGWVGSHATGINDYAQISGFATLRGGITRGFTTDPFGSFYDLGTFGGLNSRASGINNAGVAVGWAETVSGVAHAFRTLPDRSLQDLGGLGSPSVATYGTAVNNANVVVGYGGQQGAYHVIRSNGDGGLDDLGVLPGFSSAQANGINNLGQIVGVAMGSSGASSAFFYSDQTGFVDLTATVGAAAGWLLTSATAINDRGQIAGTGIYKGQIHAIRLDLSFDPVAVPEPSVIALAGVGLIWLAGCCRRSRPPGPAPR